MSLQDRCGGAEPGSPDRLDDGYPAGCGCLMLAFLLMALLGRIAGC